MDNDNLNKPAPFTVTSKAPGMDKVQLGQAVQLLAETLLTGIDEFENAIKTNEKLDDFARNNERYANAYQLTRISSPNALKAWAAERLPELGISYGFSSRITREVAEQANLDENASLRIIQFADDLTMIARFCRQISEISIEVLSNSHGIEFRFRLVGKPINDRFEDAETDSFKSLSKCFSRESSFRHRIFATKESVEAQSILFRKKVRLGLKPIF